MQPLGIQALPQAMDAAAALAARLGLPLRAVALHTFPDGEIRVTAAPPAATTILYAPLDRPNDKLIALLLAAEALRREGATRLVLVAPYLCYMRQDKAFHAGEAISQKVIGGLLARTFDRIVTVDAHLHRTADIRDALPGIEAENLSAMPAIAAALAQGGVDPGTMVIGPDAESEPWTADLAGRLGLDHVVAAKTRHGDRAVEIAIPDLAKLNGRPVLLVDDVVSSGGTLGTATRLLTAAGAGPVDAVVTHALFPPEVTAALQSQGLRSLRSTTSVPHPTNAIPLDGLLAAALAREGQ